MFFAKRLLGTQSFRVSPDRSAVKSNHAKRQNVCAIRLTISSHDTEQIKNDLLSPLWVNDLETKSRNGECSQAHFRQKKTNIQRKAFAKYDMYFSQKNRYRCSTGPRTRYLGCTSLNHRISLVKHKLKKKKLILKPILNNAICIYHDPISSVSFSSQKIPR